MVTFSYAGDYGDFPWYSGTGGWSNTFIQTGHINWRSDRKWLYCPVWKMPNMFDAEGGLISWQRMYGANYNYNYTYPKLRMSSMSNPSHCDMFTDSVFYYPSSSAHLTQWLYYSSKDAGSPQRVHMRHFNGANLWFFDGHADWFSRDKLSEPNYFVVASDGFKGFYP